MNFKFIIMSKKFSIECFKVDNSIDKVIVNKCYNFDLSVGNLYFQVNIIDTDLPMSPVSCFTFASLGDALAFLYNKNIL